MESVATDRTSRARRAEAIAFLALSAAWILLLYGAFNPLMQGDSGGYVAPGCMLWGPYPVMLWDGARTAVYPLFLSALQHVYSGKCLMEPEPGALELVTAVQLVLYVASIAYLYRALADFGPVVRLAGMAAIVLSPLHGLFTRQILTEALAAPLLLVFLAHLLRFVLRGRSDRDATVCFALYAVLTLTRPNALLPLLPAIAAVLWLGKHRRNLLVRASVAIGVPLLAAATVNYANTRHFKLANFDGYIKSHVVYNLFDRVHPEDAVLGSIMSRQHQIDLRSGQADGQVVWRSIDEIRKALDRMPFRKRNPTTAGTSDLNAYLGKVSDYLIRENPGVVLDNARRTAGQFWDTGVQHIPRTGGDPRSPGHDGNIRSDALYALFLGAQPVYDGLIRLSVAFVPVLLLVGLYLRGGGGVALPLLLYAMYLCNMVLVAMFNVVQQRYLTIMQPLLVMSLCLAVQSLVDEMRSFTRAEVA